MYTKATDGRTSLVQKTLSIGIITCDPVIGRDETLRRLLGVFGGTMQAGPAREAIVGFVDFRPYEMSAAMPWLASQLSPLGICWLEAFTSLCRMSLRPVRNASQCRWCNSRRRFHATHRDGKYLGVACAKCGNIVNQGRIAQRFPR